MTLSEQIEVAFQTFRGLVLDDLDGRLRNETPDLSAVAPEHAAGYAAGFRRAMGITREIIEAMKSGDPA